MLPGIHDVFKSVPGLATDLSLPGISGGKCGIVNISPGGVLTRPGRHTAVVIVLMSVLGEVLTGSKFRVIPAGAGWRLQWPAEAIDCMEVRKLSALFDELRDM